MSINKNEFIRFMSNAGVIRFGEFITKSGRNTPYFVNTGNYRTGAQISALGKYYASLIYETLADNFDAAFGPAYKGIPLVTAAASALYDNFNIDKPYFFNRKEAKDHGEGGMLIGYKPQDGDKIIIVEDVITAGTAVRETVPFLSELADIKCTDMFISVNRCEKGNNGKTAMSEIKEEFGIDVHSIVTVKDIYEYLKLDADTAEEKVVVTRMEKYMDEYCIF